MPTFLDFEQPIADLEGKLAEMRHMVEQRDPGEDGGVDLAEEIGRLETKVDRLLKATYAKLTPWQKVLVARHPERPHAVDYIGRLISEFTPLAGDRRFAEDEAVIGGIGRFRERSVVVIGLEKGSDIDSRMRHNFGMARPEGYRKAQRLMELANRFALPVVTLVDTAGAYPGIGAEERGQAEAIARSIESCLLARVPIVACVIGEGGSGGAIALAAGDRILMMEHAYYSVISPEGCASILWRSSEKAQEAAEALKLTAQDLKALGAVDVVVDEPVGGAHRAPNRAIDALGDEIAQALAATEGFDAVQRCRNRREKFLAMGRPVDG